MRCSSSCFPCVGVRLVYWSLRSTATFVISFHRSLLLAFSLHFSSSFAFLKSLFTQSSHLSCGLPRFLDPSCCILMIKNVSYLFVVSSQLQYCVPMCRHVNCLLSDIHSFVANLFPKWSHNNDIQYWKRRMLK